MKITKLVRTWIIIGHEYHTRATQDFASKHGLLFVNENSMFFSEEGGHQNMPSQVHILWLNVTNENKSRSS